MQARIESWIARLLESSSVRLDRFNRRRSRIGMVLALVLGILVLGTAFSASGSRPERIVVGLLMLTTSAALYYSTTLSLGYFLIVLVPLGAVFGLSLSEESLIPLYYSWIAIILALLFWSMEGIVVLGILDLVGWAIAFLSFGAQLFSGASGQALGVIFLINVALIGAGALMRYFESIRQADLESSLAQALRGQAELEEAARVKNEFLAVVSHEIRTPLNSVNGYADMLLKGIGLEDGQSVTGQVAELVKVIKRSGQTILRLVNQILEMSKIDADKIEVVNQPFMPSGLLELVQQEMEPLARDKELEFICEVDSSLPEALVGDKNLLRQILINLVTNAIKYTEAGRVHVRLAAHGPEKWDIRVADTGIGIPPDQIGVIFERFRQVDGGSEQSFGGIGLGLAICQELALRMGGTIKVDSVVGKGSTFTAVLPLNQLGQSIEQRAEEVLG